MTVLPDSGTYQTPAMSIFRRKREPLGTAPVPPAAGVFRIRQLRLYQPDDELAVRLPDGVGELVAYVQTLTWTCNEYLSRLRQDFAPMGILIVVGVRPSRRVRLWCEQVGGTIPDDIWATLTELLDGAGSAVRPQVTAPVAFAIEGLVGDGPATGFPEAPGAWLDAARLASDESVGIPDEMFDLVFAD